MAPEGLVSWWPGDGDAADIEGNNNGALQNGAAFDTGYVGQAFSLDGVDDHVLIPDADSLSFGDGVSDQPFTINAWVRMDNEIEFTIASKFDGSPNNEWLFRGGSPIGDLLLALYDENGPDHIVRRTDPGSEAAQVGIWTHYTATYDGSGSSAGIKMYRNGVRVDTMASDSGVYVAMHNTTTNVEIGRSLGGVLDDASDGLIDEVQIFDRALTASEVQAIFDAGFAGTCKDEDGDGFRPPDDCDETDPTVNPDGLELPGNFVDENCDGSLGDVDPCADWQNHGKYVRAVAHAVNDLVDAGLITEEEGDGLVSSSAQSKIGKTGFVPVECP